MRSGSVISGDGGAIELPFARTRKRERGYQGYYSAPWSYAVIAAKLALIFVAILSGMPNAFIALFLFS
jgi:hypothetical protein